MPVMIGQQLFRAWLARLLGLLVLLVVGALGLVLFASMAPTSKAVAEGVIKLDLVNIQTGAPEFFTAQSKKLIVIRPSAEQWSVLKSLRPNQDARQEPSYVAQLGLFVYWGHSSRDDHCELQYFPPAPSRLKDVVADAEWRGGFFDPACEVSFDLSGRPIIDYRLSYNGYVREDARPLRVPKLRVSGESIAVLPN